MRTKRLLDELQFPSDWSETIDLLLEYTSLKKIMRERKAELDEIEHLLEVANRTITDRLNLA
jgi:hypothetical protein